MVSSRQQPAQWRVVIDRTRCIGAGTCTALVPAVITADTEGPTVLHSPVYADPTLADAASCCPAQAIRITDTDGAIVYDGGGKHG